MGSEDGFLSSALTLITFLLILIVTCVEAQYRIIGSPKAVMAAPGDDVILTCRVDPELNLAEQTVEWSKPNLPPDPRDRLKGEEYVHQYRDAGEVLDLQMEAYRGRTMLFKDGLKHGNISLKIFSVSEEDGGRYRCLIPKLGGQTQSSIISLIIDSAKTRTTKTPLGLIIPQSSKESGKLQDRGKPQDRDHQKWLVPVVVVSVFLVLGFGLYKFYVSKKKSEVLPI
ncbi:myelin-oligodendrocyte glycoprotein-like [Parambassis ranga]|uniref:Myelin-oligodendrocyte glycoprotein-like n=1 Tax=Parambassis ranga TaxID=210632 RepID=A0A6P7IA03_9TELE|nr:myelin-oligodendrocyte glycoprotein-like [Parambassis ranga]